MSAARQRTSNYNDLQAVTKAPAPVKRKSKSKKKKAKGVRNWHRIPGKKVLLAKLLLDCGYLRKPIAILLGIHETTVGLIARGERMP